MSQIAILEAEADLEDPRPKVQDNAILFHCV